MGVESADASIFCFFREPAAGALGSLGARGLRGFFSLGTSAAFLAAAASGSFFLRVCLGFLVIVSCDGALALPFVVFVEVDVAGCGCGGWESWGNATSPGRKNMGCAGATLMVSESPCGGEDMGEESLELCPSPAAAMTNTKNEKGSRVVQRLRCNK